jgi:hypothetical protein
MRHSRFFSSIATSGLFLAALASLAAGQVTAKLPTIPAGQFASGSAKLTVTGTFQINEDVAINAPASFGDGAMTWIQYGVSGAEAPNVLITYAEGSYGIIVGRGKRIATAEPEHCSGTTQVTGKTVSGHYTCNGVVSYDAATGSMGKINIEVRFTATL